MNHNLRSCTIAGVVFLCALEINGCSRSEPVQIKTNNETLDIAKKLGQDVCFFTPRSRPAHSLSGLKEYALAFNIGMGSFSEIVKLQKAAGIANPEEVHMVLLGSLKEGLPSVYVTSCSLRSHDAMKPFASAILVTE